MFQYPDRALAKPQPALETERVRRIVIADCVSRRSATIESVPTAIVQPAAISSVSGSGCDVAVHADAVLIVATEVANRCRGFCKGKLLVG